MFVQQKDGAYNYQVEESSTDEFLLAIKQRKDTLPDEESIRMTYLEAKFNHFRNIETP